MTKVLTIAGPIIKDLSRRLTHEEELAIRYLELTDIMNDGKNHDDICSEWNQTWAELYQLTKGQQGYLDQLFCWARLFRPHITEEHL